MRYELTAAELHADLLKPGSAFIDYDGDLNLLMDDYQVVTFEEFTAPFVAGSLETYLKHNRIRKILPHGTKITLTV